MGAIDDSPAEHVPVLVEEILEYLNPAPGNVIVDATVGLGGHSSLILERIAPDGCVIGIDRDEEALQRAKKRLQKTNGHFRLFHADYAAFETVLKEADMTAIDGCLFDLGISTWQVVTPDRGFSYLEEGPLDMRMDRSDGPTAYDIVNGYPHEELRRIFREYGDERFPGRVARAVIEAREQKPIANTAELAAVLRRASRGRKGTRHPEAALFQAIRIEVNREFDSIKTGLSAAVTALKAGGRLCVISFHSGEDRIVKNILRDFRDQGQLKLINRKPLMAGESEIAVNPNARSARLRIAERIQ